jgi:hypothetical protein
MYYENNRKTMKDCWHYQTVHNESNCIARIRDPYVVSFYDMQEANTVDCWAYVSGTDAEMYSSCVDRATHDLSTNSGYL